MQIRIWADVTLGQRNAERQRRLRASEVRSRSVSERSEREMEGG